MQGPEPSSIGRKQDILRQALKRKTPLERASFLDGACGADAALRVEIEAVLAIHAGGEKGPALNAEADTGPLGEGTAEIAATLLDQTPLTEGPGTVIARYKILEKIGEGGFGVVYVAEQREPVKRRVALKIIKLGMDTKQVVARFELERQALALMDHPNIAKVFDAGATGQGRPFFVMELVHGIRITEYCDQHHLPTRERLDLFVKVCHAIHHAHQKGIIHRDIKPSNILVTLHDGVPVPKVIDFGIAKATQGELTEKTVYTQFEQFIGTPAYMSPEQAEMSGLPIDTRSDIYSLGVLLYELLTGKTPFDSTELVAAGLDNMRRIIREQEPMRPSTRLSTLEVEEQTQVAKRRGSQPPKLIRLVRGDLDWIVMKCLEKDRVRRYDNAQCLALDIEHHLTDRPIAARPPSLLYRFRRLIRRNQHAVAVASGSAIFTLLALLLILKVWQRGDGTLEFTSAPSGAEVWMNNALLGVTPYRKAQLRPGDLDFELRLSGYQTFRGTITIPPHRQARLKVLLWKPPLLEAQHAQQISAAEPETGEQRYQAEMRSAQEATKRTDYSNALAESVQALHSKANDSAANKLRDDAQQEINRMEVARQKEEEFRRLINAAGLAIQQGNYIAARADAVRALDIKTNDPVATKLRDIAQQEINLMNLAVQQEQEFRQLTNAAWLAYQQGSYTNARAEAVRALDIKTNDLVATKLRDIAQQEINRMDVARQQEQEFQRLTNGARLAYSQVKAKESEAAKLKPDAQVLTAQVKVASTSNRLDQLREPAGLKTSPHPNLEAAPGKLGGPAAEITAIEGKVEVRRAGANKWELSALGDVVFPGDIFRTGSKSRATLKFRDQTVLILNELTTTVVVPGPSEKPVRVPFNTIIRG